MDGHVMTYPIDKSRDLWMWEIRIDGNIVQAGTGTSRENALENYEKWVAGPKQSAAPPETPF